MFSYDGIYMMVKELYDHQKDQNGENCKEEERPTQQLPIEVFILSLEKRNRGLKKTHPLKIKKTNGATGLVRIVWIRLNKNCVLFCY